MIKINLVSEGRKPVVARQKAAPEVARAPSQDAALYMLIVGAAAVLSVAGGWWFLLNREISQNQEKIQVAQRRVDELQEFIRQVEEFERKEAELQLKISVITDLKNNQKGPVRVMDELSRGLPELLWLNRLTQKGNSVTLQGQAFNHNAVASYLENIDSVPEFREPILRSSTEARDVVNFTILFNFNLAPPAAEDQGAETETVAAAAGG